MFNQIIEHFELDVGTFSKNSNICLHKLMISIRLKKANKKYCKRHRYKSNSKCSRNT